MRRISDMYQRSGGAMWKQFCKDCKYCTVPKDEKKEVCYLHPEKPEWNPKWTACQWFIVKGSTEEHQISLFEM